ncbi:unnamed protein product [Trichogramma brassicae]|uniref:Uncharacterized protein n=1 Tax=Trichogramma brassicae TaxID=86971 RepID=A0A6H5ITI9_9HYME|nr:unnamed protein product [Trichogramma brassicae]
MRQGLCSTARSSARLSRAFLRYPRPTYRNNVPRTNRPLTSCAAHPALETFAVRCWVATMLASDLRVLLSPPPGPSSAHRVTVVKLGPFSLSFTAILALGRAFTTLPPNPAGCSKRDLVISSYQAPVWSCCLLRAITLYCTRCDQLPLCLPVTSGLSALLFKSRYSIRYLWSLASD